MKYRKKPVVIDAIQWTGDNYPEVFEFTEGNACHAKSHSSTLIVETLEGNMVAEKDCYIIRGVSSTCDDNGTIATAILLAIILPHPLRLIPISILLTGIFTGFAYLTYLWFKI